MKPKLVRGTRDFSPAVVNKRNYIFDTLRSVFVKYGFNPLETPAMEELSTLTGKYGDEGDQLLFKILNNGDYLAKANETALNNKNSSQLTASISQRALRYDLTVPFARYVVLNRNDIAFPFKRYQIQPVWRADKPQKGRYREFYQCDVDVIGSESLLYEAELCQIYDEAFAKLNLGVVIRLNNRKILDGLAQYAGYPNLFTQITVAIDKLDKIGWDGVQKELERLGIDELGFEKVKAVINAPDIPTLKTIFAGIEVGLKGIEELETVQAFLEGYAFKNTLKIDFSLARGLSYYTGCIYEVEVDTSIESQKDIKMGSIGGGGRYADLTGIFGLKDTSGVGVSFGAARIYDVMEELNLFEQIPVSSSNVLFLAMDEAALKYGFKALQKVRAAGISSTIYPKAWKFQKLMKYADKVKVPYVVIIGSKEMESGALGFKNMTTGEQQSLNIEAIIEQLKSE
ncbi:histidine--tRNA ligase [Aureispira anguillae]|uniref:Histidine--tRNA ligase n=1 Tax=Aureispira anguillae TaxID=2864201 RepID=A0A915VKE2_9BACT|nr:histidine--tRNA ligase [Aureispira anguillae]BDS09643.1 histidine--tRNA ligase [Aureispira anguillae]